MNRVTILGNITRDIEIRHTQSGTAIASFGIAVNRKWKDQNGQVQEEVSFFDVTAFGRQAEVIQQHMGKGSRILIGGRLKQESWTDQQGGKRSKVVIILEDFDFIDRKQDGGPSYGQAQQAPAGRAPAGQQYQQQPATQPIPEVDFNEDSIPFGYIGLSEGRAYVHCI